MTDHYRHDVVVCPHWRDEGVDQPQPPWVEDFDPREPPVCDYGHQMTEVVAYQTWLAVMMR